MYKEFGKKPKFTLVLAVIAIAASLLGTTAISAISTQNVLAYDRSQATAQANVCGNGYIPTNVGCQNTGSQIQGDKNTVALSSQQTFPAGADPCVACFNSLSAEERADFEETISAFTIGQASTIEELCALFEILIPSQQETILFLMSAALVTIGVDQPTIQEIVQCLRDVLDLPPSPPPP